MSAMDLGSVMGAIDAAKLNALAQRLTRESGVKEEVSWAEQSSPKFASRTEDV
jgi:hypothetical protein